MREVRTERESVTRRLLLEPVAELVADFDGREQLQREDGARCSSDHRGNVMTSNNRDTNHSYRTAGARS